MPKLVSVERLLQLVAVHHADVHLVGERGSEDARVADRPRVGRQTVVAAAGLAHATPGKFDGTVTA